MDCFLTQRPCLNPPRACDLLGERDKLYSGAHGGNKGCEDDDDPDSEDFMPEERDPTLLHTPGGLRPILHRHPASQPRASNTDPLGKGKGKVLIRGKKLLL
jgi:hypothetical protein